jgi:hypothetical protein
MSFESCTGLLFADAAEAMNRHAAVIAVQRKTTAAKGSVGLMEDALKTMLFPNRKLSITPNSVGHFFQRLLTGIQQMVYSKRN